MMRSGDDLITLVVAMHDPKNGVAVRDNSTSYLNHFPKSFCGYDAVVFLEKCCQISKEEVCGCLCVVFVCVGGSYVA